MKRLLITGLLIAVSGLTAVKADGIWKAGNIDSFQWSVDKNNWVQQIGYPQTLTYDDNGLLKTMISGDRKQTYEYNDDSLPVAVYSYGLDEESGIWNETQVQTFEYDDVVRSWVVRTEVKADWGNYGSGMRVERDDAGNIIKMVRYGFADSDTRTYETTELTYGQDGTAVSMTVTGNDGKVMLSMTDVEWENTNGQITDLTYETYNGKLYFGDNRIKSAKIESTSLSDSGDLNVKYEDEDYLSTLASNGEKVREIEYKSIDENDSFEVKVFQVQYAEGQEDDKNEISGNSEDFQRFIYDSYGMLLENTVERVYRYADAEKEKSYHQTIGTVEYDPEHGYPLEYISSYNTGNPAESVFNFKVLYSDYSLYGSTKVETIESAAGEPEYYTIDGLRVLRPVKGFYIRRIGNQTTKIYL